MKNWLFMEQSSGLVMDSEGSKSIVGTDIDGWNDDVNFSDLERVAYVELAFDEETNELTEKVTFFYEEAKSNVMVLTLIKEAKNK
jgi:hypothetical protein